MKDYEIIIGFALLVGCGWLLYRLWEKRRTSSVHLVAEQLGFTFSKEEDLSFIPNAEFFSLMSKGRGRKIINCMTSPGSVGEPTIFGYKYTSGSGKNSTTYAQTVAWFSHNKPLASFELRPENVFHKIGSMFGYSDIDFEDRPKFSQMYLLKGEDDTGAVTGLFSSFITDYFERHPGISVESNESGMLIYFNNRRLSKDEIIVFYEQAKNIYSLFTTGLAAGNIDTHITVKSPVRRATLFILSLCLGIAIIMGIEFANKNNDSRPENQNNTSALISGWNAYENGDYATAIKLYNSHITDNESDRDGYFYRGLAHEKDNNDKAALEDFLLTIKIDANYFDAYLHIDYLLAKELKFEEIIRYWNSYIQTNNSNARAYLERGGAYFHSGQKKAALEDAQQACDLGEEKGCQLVEQFN